MKRCFILVALLGLIGSIWSHPVDSTRAELVARHYLKLVGGEGKMLRAKEWVRVSLTPDFQNFYVFAGVDGKGFVMVSADDEAYPILGYSGSSRFSMEGMPEHVFNWLKNYERQIDYIRDHENSFDPTIRELWDHLDSERPVTLALTHSVEPLISTQWDQGMYYNGRCPEYATNTKSAVGCVATATGQIMKYWNWPSTGWGSHSYNTSRYGTLSADFANTTYVWDSMPNVLNSSSTEGQVSAVSELLYHIGVAINMSYGAASGAQSSSNELVTRASAENALKTYFRYKSTMVTICRNDYSDEHWCALLRNELDQSRPILYSGYGGGGHCFVFDGYNQSGMFHVNWGWSGYCDAYYTVGFLNPSVGGIGSSSSGTYNLSNRAVIRIEPNEFPSQNTIIALSASNSQWGSVTGSGIYNNMEDTVTMVATATTAHRFVEWSDGVRYNPRSFVASGNNMNITAIFEPLRGDTLGYCSGASLDQPVGLSTRDNRWGIKLPAEVLTPNHDLYQVQFFAADTSSVELLIYTGANSPQTLVHSQRYTSVMEDAWNEIMLNETVNVTGDENIWITFRATTSSAPVSVTYWCGNTDGQYMANSTGTSWSPRSAQRTMMIRGIFSERPPEGFCRNPFMDDIGSASNVRTDYRMPVNNYYKYSMCETIVDSSELSGPMDIKSLSIYYPTASAMTAKNNCTIYFQPTHRSTFNSVSDVESLNDSSVMVYSGQLNCKYGWNEFEFDQIYHYDGTSNLMILFDDNSQSYNGSRYRYDVSPTQGKKTIIFYTDNTNPNMYNLSSYTSNRTCTDVRPLMRLTGCPVSESNSNNDDSGDGSSDTHVDTVIVRDTIYHCATSMLQVQSSDLSMGMTAGLGVYPTHSQVQIMAMPYRGYRFLGWNDSVMDNPRTLTLDHDSVVTALFGPLIPPGSYDDEEEMDGDDDGDSDSGSESGSDSDGDPNSDTDGNGGTDDDGDDVITSFDFDTDDDGSTDDDDDSSDDDDDDDRDTDWIEY